MNIRTLSSPAFSLSGAIALLLLGSLASGAAQAKCSHETTITNSSGIVLRIVELKSAVSPPTIYKKQWSGERAIQPGGTTTINWTSDWNCIDGGTGQPNHWDVKFFRKDGTVHHCGGLAQSQDVRINTPDLCFPN
jgi:hypothetical protein